MAQWYNLPRLVVSVAVALSGLIAYFLFRPFEKRQLVGRMPLFLATGGALLWIATVDLPEAWPRLFVFVLGHSLNELVTHRSSDGTVMTENWLTYWGESVGTAFYFSLLVAVVWAITNLLRRYAIRTNVITLVVVFGWACVFVWATLARFPF